ncbi:LOW QUALITY PROTEIN: RNA helicase aquarius [Homalodisca vitripennis]|uniref:LOW QUALITY PROTEIN: RNA helicase aquarius n=1 Tax=Homalodisca vitripennis TaxID=197043 RepID=UPI001EEBF8A2|nr:LOW QUALITY PROTEIN: RNA helicase aquarius [Homalodisca vitripennis]
MLLKATVIVNLLIFSVSGSEYLPSEADSEDSNADGNDEELDANEQNNETANGDVPETDDGPNGETETCTGNDDDGNEWDDIKSTVRQFPYTDNEGFAIRRTMMLEFSQYLENYLWPNNYVTGLASHEHMMSIVVMLNEKFRERVPAWEAFKKRPENFPGFFQQMLEACLGVASLREKTALIVFLNHAFNSMEVELIREQVKRLVSLSMWVSLQEGRREQELKKAPKWRKFWMKINKRDSPETKQKLEWERKFLHRLMLNFIDTLEAIPSKGEVSGETIQYCERFLELMIDLEALLPTRRFFNTVLDDCHLVVRCYLAALPHRDDGNLFAQVSLCTLCHLVLQSNIKMYSNCLF